MALNLQTWYFSLGVFPRGASTTGVRLMPTLFLPLGILRCPKILRLATSRPAIPTLVRCSLNSMVTRNKAQIPPKQFLMKTVWLLWDIMMGGPSYTKRTLSYGYPLSVFPACCSENFPLSLSLCLLQQSCLAVIDRLITVRAVWYHDCKHSALTQDVVMAVSEKIHTSRHLSS